jgi:hypothetical protein
MSSSREEGWLETKIGRAEKWERKWVVFDDGVLYYSTEKDADRDDDDMVTRVPMDRVISLRTDVSAFYHFYWVVLNSIILNSITLCIALLLYLSFLFFSIAFIACIYSSFNSFLFRCELM